MALLEDVRNAVVAECGDEFNPLEIGLEVSQHDASLQHIVVYEDDGDLFIGYVKFNGDNTPEIVIYPADEPLYD